MKIFKMNDIDWVVASCLEEATEFYLKETDQDAEEAFFDGDPEEVTEAQMDTLVLNFRDETPPRKVTFRQELQRLNDLGVTFPTIFASTEY